MFEIRGAGQPENAVQGLHKRADEIASRLQRAADRNQNFKPGYWPTHNVGEKFEQIILKHLMAAEPPEISNESRVSGGEIKGMWSLTKKWRFDCVEEAINRTHKLVKVGLRRGELLNAVGRSLGLPNDSTIHDVVDLFDLPQTVQEKRAIKLFCRWVNECYYYNQAIEFGCTPCFPAFDESGGLMAVSLLSQENATMPVSEVGLRLVVPHPPIKALMDVPANELLAIRDDLGYQYFFALDNWQKHPNASTEEEVKHTLFLYTQNILKMAKLWVEFSDGLLEVTGGKGNRNQQLLTSSLNLLKTIPFIESLIVLFEESFALYQVYLPPKEENNITLRSTKTPDLNLPSF